MESFIYVKYNIKPAIEQKYFFSLFCLIQIDFPISGTAVMLSNIITRLSWPKKLNKKEYITIMI